MVSEYLQGGPIRYTTYIRCAKCGKENAIVSSDRNIGTLTILNNKLMLTCQHCASIYPIVDIKGFGNV